MMLEIGALLLPTCSTTREIAGLDVDIDPEYAYYPVVNRIYGMERA
jgi:hypothetical protein